MINQKPPPQSTLFYRFAMLLVVPGLVYGFLALGVMVTHLNTNDGMFSANLINFLSVLVIVSMNVVVGLLIVRRASGNVVGPLLILFGTGIPGWKMPDNIAGPLLTLFGMVIPGGKAPVEVAIEQAVRPFFAPLVFWAVLCLIAFFPSGRVYFRRIAPAIIAAAILYVISVYLHGFSQPINPQPGRASTSQNPLFIPALAPLSGLADVLANGFAVLLLYDVIFIIPHYRRADQHERQQMKWLAFGTGVFIVGLGVFVALGTDSIAGKVYGTVFLLWTYLFPSITIGNAILRHRLYDIDIIIRRTLIYGLLTGILAAVYFGTVVLVQQVFRALTGQAPEITIVISTLVIAALFNPLRRRIQNVIDRRLYRRKYDAEKTLEAFSRTLREDVDIETLKGTLIGVVQETMQPTHVALWVREPGHTALKEQVK